MGAWMLKISMKVEEQRSTSCPREKRSSKFLEVIGAAHLEEDRFKDLAKEVFKSFLGSGKLHAIMQNSAETPLVQIKRRRSSKFLEVIGAAHLEEDRFKDLAKEVFKSFLGSGKLHAIMQNSAETPLVQIKRGLTRVVGVVGGPRVDAITGGLFRGNGLALCMVGWNPSAMALQSSRGHHKCTTRPSSTYILLGDDVPLEQALEVEEDPAPSA
ncbi:hypothetical protein LR48_Vigan04g058500 [Vigna angularis]|uniref:Uncharacterized protein n=1 Tax=Phaseolus angularis TaxID=3914 RepID=A0A0L9UCV2_PHAAN|nr:hypothetical protein LR48_Vigan04g058500 [Vigna angularis]